MHCNPGVLNLHAMDQAATIAREERIGRAGTAPGYSAAARHLPGLHGLRGVAALLILVLHVFDMPGLPPPLGFGWVVKALHLAVMLFFVLSALCLLHAQAPLMGRPRWVAAYALKRFFRIAPLFYFALVLAILVAPGRLPTGDLLLHLAFLFNLTPRFVGSFVPAGWAIGVEMLAYLGLPMILLRIRALQAALWLFLACLAASFACRLVLPALVSAEFGTWFLGSNLVFFAAGVLAWRALLEFRLDWRPIGLASLVALPVLAALHAVSPAGEPDAVLWALPFAGLCAWQASAPSAWLTSRPLQWIGEHSFSIYLLHPFLIAVLGAAVFPQLIEAAPVLWPVLVVLLTMAIALPVAALGYAFVEWPGQVLGRRLIRHLGA